MSRRNKTSLRVKRIPSANTPTPDGSQRRGYNVNLQLNNLKNPKKPKASISKSPELSESWLVGGGEMGELIRSIDWGATPLGALDTWSLPLRAAVNIVLRETTISQNTSSSGTRLMVKKEGRIMFVSPMEIDWAEAAGNYVILHVGEEKHLVRETMNALEAQLPKEIFGRVSRSAILNLHRIKELHSLSSGEHLAILADGERVPISRNLREIEERLKQVAL